MLRGFRSYTQFLDSYERIATNILAHRLKKLEALWNHRDATRPVRRKKTHLHSHGKRNGPGARPNRNGPLDRGPRRASKSRADSPDQKRQTEIPDHRPAKMVGKFLTGGVTEGNRALFSHSAAVWPRRVQASTRVNRYYRARSTRYFIS